MESVSIPQRVYVQHAAYIVQQYAQVSDANKADIESEMQALAEIELPGYRGSFSQVLGVIVVADGLWTMWNNWQMQFSQEDSQNMLFGLNNGTAINNFLFCMKAALMYGSAAAVDGLLGGATARKTQELAREIFTIAKYVKDPKEAIAALKNVLKEQNIKPVQCQEIEDYRADKLGKRMFN